MKKVFYKDGIMAATTQHMEGAPSNIVIREG